MFPCFFALQPRGVIARTNRCPASVAAYGENVSVHWRPDATSLAVLVRTALSKRHSGRFFNDSK